MSQSLSQLPAPTQAVSRKIVIHENLPTGFPPRRRRCEGSRLSRLVPDWAVARMPRYLHATYHGHHRLCAGQNRSYFIRQLTAEVGEGITDRTIRRHNAELEKRGLLLIIPTLIGPEENGPNLYVLLDMEGGYMYGTPPDTNVREKQVLKNFKTNTNTRGSDEPGGTLPVKPEAKAGPAYSRSAENHDPATRQRVEHNAQARHHRLTRSHHRPDAFVGSGVRPDGYYSGETAPETAEERAFRERVMAREREFRGGAR